MSYETLQVTREGETVIVTLNRPEKLNAFNSPMLTDMLKVSDELRQDYQSRFVVLTGAGRAFSSGADLQENKALQEAGRETFMIQRRHGQHLAHLLMYSWERLEQVTIAAVNGLAIGAGVALALACDMRIAAQSATFSIPEANVGVFFTWGSTPRLTRLVGPAKAKELIMTCDTVSAAEALSIGLVNKVAPEGELMAVTGALIEKIASRAPIAVRLTKTIVNAVSTPALGDVGYYEPDLAQMCFGTEDVAEANAAFFEKRPPRFTGKL